MIDMILIAGASSLYGPVRAHGRTVRSEQKEPKHPLMIRPASIPHDLPASTFITAILD
jgi:hypothetical protein